MLALVLPVMITLPAPEDRPRGTVGIQVEVRTAPPPYVSAAMSIPRIVPEAEVAGEGDLDETALAPPAEVAAEFPPADVEVTGSLPNLPEQAVVAAHAKPIKEAALVGELVAPTAPAEAAAPVDMPAEALSEGAPERALEEEVELSTVASFEGEIAEEPDFMPDVVPRPLRKPSLKAVVHVEQEAKPVATEPAAAPRRVVSSPRPAPTPRPTQQTVKPNFKSFLGGTQAVPMKEFPFPAGR
jgi:hypothetical protein